MSAEALSASTLIQFAESIVADAPDLAFGFLYGRNADQLYESAKRIAVAQSLPSAASVQVTFTHPDFAHYVAGANSIDARLVADTPAALAELIAQPHDLIYVVGHSNGHDAGTAGVVLCRNKGRKDTGTHHRAFPCYNGAACRFPASDFAVVSADSINATCVVALLCWGVAFHDRPFSPDLSIGEGLLLHSDVRTLLTLVRAAPIDRPDFLCAYFMCNLGLPLGLVANRVNQFRRVRGYRADLICFGDPGRALPKTIVELRAERASDEVFECSLPASAQSFDAQVSVPTDAVPSSPIVVLEEGPDLKAAIFCGDSLFATVPAVRVTNTIRFRIETRESFIERGRAIRELVPDWRYLERLVRALSLETGHQEGSKLNELAAHVGLLGAAIERSPLERPEAGLVTSNRALNDLMTTLSGILEGLIDALLYMLEDLVPRGGIYLMRTVEEYVGHLPVRTTYLPCSYCGAQVEEQVRSPLFEDSERRFALCDACGPVYEGHPSTGRWIVARHALVSGSIVTMRIDVQNPYHARVPARALIAIKAFEQQQQRVFAYSPMVHLLPGECGAVHADIEVPTAFRPGVYYASAALAVGPRVTYLRAPLHIDTSDVGL